MTNNNVNIPLHKLVLILFLIAISSTISGCNFYIGDAKEVERNMDERYYQFDSITILDALKRGEPDVFMLLETSPKSLSSIPSVTVPWTQADYLRVAQAVQQFAWQESFGMLDLSYATFTLDCLDIKQETFSMVDFVFYKITQTGDVETRVQYHITIVPSENLVSTSRAEYYPNVSVLRPTELDQYNINAENALQIAEENGGAKMRSELNNFCMINGIVNGLDGWIVLYQTRNKYRWVTNFEIAINPETGSFRVIRSKP